MTPSLIGLAGYAQSGKDEVANILARDYGYTKIGFADALREFMLALDPIICGSEFGNYRYSELAANVGYEFAKKEPEVRALLQRLGADAGRNVLGQDVWVNAAMRKIQRPGKFVFTDVRFPNEYDAIVTGGGFRDGGEMWRVVRPGVGAINGHESETALDGFSYQAVINNDHSLKDLAMRVHMALGDF